MKKERVYSVISSLDGRFGKFLLGDLFRKRTAEDMLRGRTSVMVYRPDGKPVSRDNLKGIVDDKRKIGQEILGCQDCNLRKMLKVKMPDNVISNYRVLEGEESLYLELEAFTCPALIAFLGKNVVGPHAEIPAEPGKAVQEEWKITGEVFRNEAKCAQMREVKL